MLYAFFISLGIACGAVLGGSLVLHTLAMLGSPGKRVLGACSRAPILDLIVAWFTIVPAIAMTIAFAWVGLGGAILGQMLGLTLWCWGHEITHRKAVKGARIVTVLNRVVGRPRNHLALWVTSIAVPVFWVVRIGEWIVYPPLIVLVRFPHYPMGEWVNVSRHKFDGLVGHDLIWCLYCDWMTGVWSLGSEMLRNVESFWCPIRFLDDKKCANCSVDFPDVFKGWTPADGTMDDVARLLSEKYEGQDKDARNSWFGHPGRIQLTVEGDSIES
ncbi:MAG: hypothetical protein ACF8MF_05840 [Phycisphaerales bacterium JB052]